jgi:hypothetical protein
MVDVLVLRILITDTELFYDIEKIENDVFVKHIFGYIEIL